MKTNILTAALLAATAFATPVVAQDEASPQAAAVAAVDDANAAQAAPAPDAAPAKPTTEVVSRGTDGLADVVNIDGQSYKVCKGEVQDSCINPRTAGLKFGARDLQYWPGRPASEISTPLPASPPANLPVEDPATAPG